MPAKRGRSLYEPLISGVQSIPRPIGTIFPTRSFEANKRSLSTNRPSRDVNGSLWTVTKYWESENRLRGPYSSSHTRTTYFDSLRTWLEGTVSCRQRRATGDLPLVPHSREWWRKQEECSIVSPNDSIVRSPADITTNLSSDRWSIIRKEPLL